MDYDDFTDDQKKVIEHGKGALLVEAGPGSGKTTVIVERIKHIIKMKKERKEEVDPKSFLVITFTNKATENLKFKLRKEFSNDFVSKMQISTIHSFCFNYLKNDCKNKEKYSALTLIDDEASERKSLFIQKSKNALGFEKEYSIFDNQIPTVVKKFSEYTSFNVDTDALVENIKSSRKVCPAYVKFARSLKYVTNKRIKDYDKEFKRLQKKNSEALSEDDQKCEGIKKSWYNATYFKIADSYPEYLKLLDEEKYVDYDNLQRKTLEELKANHEHPYKVIFVDEFQDTDPLQFRIFRYLNKSCDYFTAVGDVDQHIYAFRSSFNNFFFEFKKLVPDHCSLPLNDNFRSTEKIVNLTEEFIGPQRNVDSGKNMQNRRIDCNNPNLLIKNSVIDEENDADKLYEIESENIYEIIKYLMENGKIKDYSDVAILYRKHSDKTITNLINKFKEKSIDFSVKGRKDLSDQNEVRTILALIWYISRKTNIGHVPSDGELKESNLKALSGEYFETSFFSLDDSTKEYLCKLQDSYYMDITKKEFDLSEDVSLDEVLNNKVLMRGVHKWKNNYNEQYGKDPSLEEILIYKAANIRNRQTMDDLHEIFKDLQMPIVDIEKITNPTDKELFKQLESIRNEIKSKDSQTFENSGNEEKKEEPLTILDVFYKLIALSNLYNYELGYEEIANLAILTQTISNYESFISETDLRGVSFFLNRAIKNYDSYQKEGSGVQLMTIHSAKGLEFPVTIIPSLQKDQFPPKVRDPNRTDEYINGTPTYYTPNECLKYKKFINEDGVCELLSIKEENKRDKAEEERVLYVAMTRAEDLLILSTIGEVPCKIEDIEEHTESFSSHEISKVFDKLSEVKIPSAFKEPDKKKDIEDEPESLEDPVVLNYSKYTKYISCPYKYDLSYNLGFRRSGSAKAANRGSAFHNIMENLNQKLINGETVSKDKLEEITTEFYESMLDIEKNEKDFEEFKNNVKNYYVNYSLNREVLDAEFDFELYIDKNILKEWDVEDCGIDFMLNGAIDLIYKVSDDEIIILDYKYAEFDKDHVGAYEKQSYIYAFALSQIPEYKDYKINKAIIHFILGDGKNKKPYPHEVKIDEKDIKEELENMVDVAKKIYGGVYKKEPEKVDECENCSYRYFCKPKKFAHQLYD